MSIRTKFLFALLALAAAPLTAQPPSFEKAAAMARNSIVTVRISLPDGRSAGARDDDYFSIDA